MKKRPASIDDAAELGEMFSTSEALLLDFDGPVCSVFANYPASLVARKLQVILADMVDVEIPDEVRQTSDPFDILRFAVTIGTVEAERLDSELRNCEIEAVASAEPTPGSHVLIRRWNRRLAIVSNNSTAAVGAYIERYGLQDHVDHIAGREVHSLHRLKPAPYLVSKAVEVLATKSEHCILIGDSKVDLIAARAARCKSVGYANKPGKLELLKDADAVVTTIRMIADIVSGPKV